MLLTVLATAAGSAAGVLALDRAGEDPAALLTAEERDSQYTYSTRYSPWAANRELAEKAEIQVDVPTAVYYAVPGGLCLLVLALSLVLMAQGFRTDPIYLLSTREKE